MNFELLETKKIMVHDLVEMNSSNMINMILNNHKDNAIWCEGLMLFLIPFPPTDKMVEIAASGIEEHLLAVYYCKYQDYMEIVKSGNGMSITLTYAESNIIKGLTKWIKEKNNIG